MAVFKQKVLFTEEECKQILNKYNQRPVDDSQVDMGISYTFKNMVYEEDKWIIDRISEWMDEQLKVKIDWNNSDIKEFYLQTYKVGDKFGRHNDNGHNRIYGVGLLLNDDFEGGKFVVDIDVLTHGIMTFKKITGNCYLFETSHQHELYEITEGERNIVLVFFRKSQIKFKNMGGLI